MNKAWKRRVFLVVVLLIGFLAALFFWLMNKTDRRKWTEDDRTLPNPDRGFYIQIESREPERILEAAKEVRLILLAFDLAKHTNEDLPKEKLKELETALDAAQEAGVSVIFRAAYGFCENVSEPDTIERAGGHIRQISEVLNRHKDSILVVQAGMLGDYGEWHSSRFLEGGEEEERKSRLYILKQWEAHLSQEIKVAVRRPRFIREAEQEHILTGRLGFHNDALLSTENDMGTYDAPGYERSDELLWADFRLSGQRNGGEMPTSGARSQPEYADLEFQKLHLLYLNLKYNEAILDSWAKKKYKGMEAKRYLENRLGYRLFCSELAVKKLHWKAGLAKKGLAFTVSFCNAGYAPPDTKYQLFFSVRAGKKEILKKVNASGLYRISCGEVWKKEVCLDIPEAFFEEEEYIKIGVKLAPEMEEADERACIELANENLEYSGGVNRLFYLARAGEFFYRTM